MYKMFRTPASVVARRVARSGVRAITTEESGVTTKEVRQIGSTMCLMWFKYTY
jgi:hypothetical protein